CFAMASAAPRASVFRRVSRVSRAASMSVRSFNSSARESLSRSMIFSNLQNRPIIGIRSDGVLLRNRPYCKYKLGNVNARRFSARSPARLFSGEGGIVGQSHDIADDPVQLKILWCI